MNGDTHMEILAAIRQKIDASEAFTAADIRDSLSTALCPVRYRDVAETIRTLYEAGKLAPFGYDRRLTDVEVAGTVVQAFLYYRRAA